MPDVFRDEVMNVIGASNTWQWIPYKNSYADVDGKKLPSVSGGTRWGGGVWINAMDMARFGYLWLRDGRWGNKQIIPPAYVKEALTPSAHGPDYGFLWWLNTSGGAKTLPTNSFQAQGAGSNTIFVSPDHDLVIVVRYSTAAEQFFRQVIDAIQTTTTAPGRTDDAERRTKNEERRRQSATPWFGRRFCSVPGSGAWSQHSSQQTSPPVDVRQETSDALVDSRQEALCSEPPSSAPPCSATTLRAAQPAPRTTADAGERRGAEERC